MRFCWLFFLLWISTLSTVTAATDSDQSNWFDHTHAVLNKQTQQAAIWFDRFFGDSFDETVPASAQLRLSSSFELIEQGQHQSDLRLRAKLRLPNARKQLYLVFSNDDEDETRLLPLESGRIVARDTDSEDFNAALRWLKENLVYGTLDTRIGISSWSHLYLRSRYHRNHRFSETTEMRIVPELFLDSEDGAGARLLSEIDQQFSHPGLVRLSLKLKSASKQPDLEWRGGLSYTFRLTDNGALTSGFYLDGAKGFDQVDNYSLSLRLRRRLWRPWFYYELEPYLRWPEEKNYRCDSGIIASLQIIFDR